MFQFSNVTDQPLTMDQCQSAPAIQEAISGWQMGMLAHERVVDAPQYIFFNNMFYFSSILECFLFKNHDFYVNFPTFNRGVASPSPQPAPNPAVGSTAAVGCAPGSLLKKNWTIKIFARFDLLTRIMYNYLPNKIDFCSKFC